MSYQSVHKMPNLAPLDVTPQLDIDLINRLITDFYASIRDDKILGPIFAEHVQDWSAHIEKLGQFWATMMLKVPGYKGTPMQAHLGLGHLGVEHFERWLMLFEVAVSKHCTSQQASLFMERAQRIARSFQYAIAQSHGEMPVGQRIASHQ